MEGVDQDGCHNSSHENQQRSDNEQLRWDANHEGDHRPYRKRCSNLRRASNRPVSSAVNQRTKEVTNCERAEQHSRIPTQPNLNGGRRDHDVDASEDHPEEKHHGHDAPKPGAPEDSTNDASLP